MLLGADLTIPPSLAQKWQSIVDILARTSCFVSALVMRVDPPEIEVCVSSRTDGNPFKPGDRASLNTDLYCEKVMATKALVHCPDALKLDPPWNNPDVTQFNMVCYYGLPILWPDGTPFGTICILDRSEKTVVVDASDLIELFRSTIEADLRQLVTAAREVEASNAVREEAEGRYTAIFQLAAVGIARVGLDGRWLEVNDKLCSIVGYSRAELSKKTFQDITFQDDLEADLDLVGQLVAGKISTYAMEKRYVHKQGHHVWVLLTVSLVRDSQGTPRYFISIIEDITEKKMLQRGIEQSQKLEAMGRLVGGIAHEFNNKLAAITGNLFLASQQRASADQYVKNAESLCFQASDMIKGLLTYARREQVEQKPLPLNAFLKDILKNLRVVSPENIDTQVEIPAEPMVVDANATQIQQIVFNLMNNAWDATETVAGPTVHFRLASEKPSPEFRSRHPHIKAEKVAVLEVRDNGTGISSADLGRIFDPFYTTKAVGKGSGLGLAMVASLVQQHGGAVEVESQPLVETRFRVFLPLLVEAKPQAPADGGTVVKAAGAGATILVVDYDLAVLDITKQVLQVLGYQVLGAQNGEQALNVFRSGQRIDCVLADIVMPVMGGVELWQRLRELDPAVKLIFMTGYNNSVEPGSMRCPVLFKPIAPNQLNKALSDILAG